MLWFEYKDTNFESYSQLNVQHNARKRVVIRVQRYKFWKLFTTTGAVLTILNLLWFEYKDTNFESYSQRMIAADSALRGCDSSTKIQILKAIHNGCRPWWSALGLWFEYKDTNFESYSQRLKIAEFSLLCCDSSTKIQILKAIHNWYNRTCVYSSTKMTFFESILQS